jgi:hypothetical protein
VRGIAFSVDVGEQRLHLARVWVRVRVRVRVRG